MDIEVPNSTVNRVLYEVAHKLDMVDNTLNDLIKHFKEQGNLAALGNHGDSDDDHKDISIQNLESVKSILDNSYTALSKIDDVQSLLGKHAQSMGLPIGTSARLSIDDAHQVLVKPTSPAFNHQFEIAIAAANKTMGLSNPDNLYQVTRNVVPTTQQKVDWQKMVDQQVDQLSSTQNNKSTTPSMG